MSWHTGIFSTSDAASSSSVNPIPTRGALHYYSTPDSDNVLGVQRNKKGQGTIISLFGLLFFSQIGIKFKTPKKNYQNPLKITVVLVLFTVYLILAEKQQPKALK